MKTLGSCKAPFCTPFLQFLVGKQPQWWRVFGFSTVKWSQVALKKSVCGSAKEKLGKSMEILYVKSQYPPRIHIETTNNLYANFEVSSNTGPLDDQTTKHSRTIESSSLWTLDFDLYGSFNAGNPCQKRRTIGSIDVYIDTEERGCQITCKTLIFHMCQDILLLVRPLNVQKII